MIDKHYGKYLGGDSEEQLKQLFEAKSETLSETFEAEERQGRGEVAGISGKRGKWAHLDSNQGPTGYEPVALTN